MTTDLNDKVVACKNALMASLGESNAQKYLLNMKLWFRYKWSKEEFDIESRKLLSAENMHFHNQFLLAILNKIDSITMPQTSSSLATTYNSTTTTSSRSSKKRKRSSRFNSERATFEQYDILDYLREDNMEEIVRPPNSLGDSPPPAFPAQRYCVQELFLPDAGFIMGRFLVGAWETGLVNVDDAVVDLVVVAVQNLLKNLLTSIILKRQSHRVTSDGTFFYDVGHPMKDPFIRNTVTRQKIDDAPLEIDKEITSMNVLRKTTDESTFLSACEEVYPKKRKIITVSDLYKAFQDKNIIPSHTVYSINMERITQMLH